MPGQSTCTNTRLFFGQLVPLHLGPCSPPRWCRGGWWAPPLRSWARPSWPPSGPEPSWTSPSPWRGLGRPRRRLRARAGLTALEGDSRAMDPACTASCLPRTRIRLPAAQATRVCLGPARTGPVKWIQPRSPIPSCRRLLLPSSWWVLMVGL